MTERLHVALRKESVDRKNKEDVSYSITIVALRKESVDRKRNAPNRLTNAHKSLSARRAWIENLWNCHIKHRLSVALRKESVDRKTRKTFA